MGVNSNANESVRFFKIIGKAEKADPAGKKAICEIVKVNDKYEISQWIGSLSGYITAMEVKEFEYENEKKKKFVIRITDDGENMQLEFSPSYATYGLINAMLQADLTKMVDIAAWIGKSGYVGSGIKYVGSQDNIEWTLATDACPKAVEYKTPSGKVEKDHTNVQNFWIEKFNEIAARQKASPVSAAAFASDAGVKTEDRRERDAEFMQDMNDVTDEDLNSLPF
jgi:hypothetical protein